LASPGSTSIRSKRVTSARRLAKRAFRTAERKFLAEGPQAVREALTLAVDQPGIVHDLFITVDAARRHDVLTARARDLGLDPHVVSGEVMESLTQTVTPQGIVAVCSFLDRPLAELTAELTAGQSRLVAVLAHVRDPGNAGTVIRTADAAGADAVVLTDASVDPYNGKCVRASVGSLFHLPFTTGATVDAAVSALKAAGLRVLAADGAGRRDLDDLIDGDDLAAPTAWLFGNEAWGLPDETLALADEVVRVPIHGKAESLNLATAAAVCLYASARAHRR
jgi:TrmH family RNA methyltransferase